MWQINHIENIKTRYNTNYTLRYSLSEGISISKHELSIDNGVTYKEITPIIENNYFVINIQTDTTTKTCYIKCTDTEGITNTSNVFTVVSEGKTNNKPTLSDLSVISQENGDYTITYKAIDKDGESLSHYISIDGGEYVQIIPEGTRTYTYKGNGLSVGNHICTIKISDGYDEVESPTLAIIIRDNTNNPPVIENLTLDYSNQFGLYKVSYKVTDDITDRLNHYLSVDSGEYKKITPLYMVDKYVYNGDGLELGNHTLNIKVSDGVNEVISESLDVNIEPEDISIKSELIASKSEYDTAYTNLRELINNSISDSVIEDTEKSDISEAIKNYNDKYAFLQETTQKAIDSIGDNKANDLKNEVSKELGDVSNALGSLDNTMNDVFKDSILTESEKITIRQSLQNMNLQKLDVDKQYNTVLNNFNQDDIGKKEWYKEIYDNLISAYNLYNEKYKNIVVVVEYLLNKQGLIDSQDKANKDKAFTEYSLAITEYTEAVNKAIDGISRNETEKNTTVIEEHYSEFIQERDNIRLEVGKKVGKDNIVSSINLSPESIKIKANKLQLDGLLSISNLENGTTTIDGDWIETGSITTDMLYPGTNNRIVLERGKSPGDVNSMSIDINSGNIRVKKDQNVYIMVGDGGFRYYNNGNRFDVNMSYDEIYLNNLSLIPKNDNGVVLTCGINASNRYFNDVYSRKYWSRTSSMGIFSIDDNIFEEERKNVSYDFFRDFSNNTKEIYKSKIDRESRASLLSNNLNQFADMYQLAEDDDTVVFGDINMLSDVQSLALEKIISKIDTLEQENQQLKTKYQELESKLLEIEQKI